jgi:hypothetical protein
LTHDVVHEADYVTRQRKKGAAVSGAF